jgi:hypothetical protein
MTLSLFSRLGRPAGVCVEWSPYDKLPNTAMSNLDKLLAPTMPQNRNVSNFRGFARRKLAGAGGLEPPTGGFGDRCSTN